MPAYHIALPLLLATTVLVAAQESKPPAIECGKPFVGFDSRTVAEVIAETPVSARYPIGFEVSDRGPVIATRTELYVAANDKLWTIPLESEATGIALNAEGRMFIQSTGSVSMVTPTGVEPIKAWAGTVRGPILNSGQPEFIEAVPSEATTRFVARLQQSDRTFGIAEADGPFRAGIWDSTGLTVVVGNRLLRWRRGSEQLDRIATDDGLRDATGVCNVDRDRVVVTLSAGTLLVSPTSMVVLGAPGGRCRVRDGKLFIFDPRLARLWRLTGLDGIGDPAKDLQHAKDLASLSAVQGRPYQETPQFGEAVRLVGCREAKAFAAEAQK